MIYKNPTEKNENCLPYNLPGHYSELLSRSVNDGGLHFIPSFRYDWSRMVFGNLCVVTSELTFKFFLVLAEHEPIWSGFSILFYNSGDFTGTVTITVNWLEWFKISICGHTAHHD